MTSPDKLTKHMVPGKDAPAATATQNKAMEDLLFEGDLSKLSAKEKAQYLLKLCHSTGLDPMTQPFTFIANRKTGKLSLYANKHAAAQLRQVNKVNLKLIYAGPYCSIAELGNGEFSLGEPINDKLFMVVLRATLKFGKEAEILLDYDIGTAWVGGSGEDLENAFMKAYTKAKRRVSLSICGIGFAEPRDVDDPVPVQKPSTPVVRDPGGGVGGMPPGLRKQAEYEDVAPPGSGDQLKTPGLKELWQKEQARGMPDVKAADTVPKPAQSAPQTGPTGKKKYPPAAGPVKLGE